MRERVLEGYGIILARTITRNRVLYAHFSRQGCWLYAALSMRGRGAKRVEMDRFRSEERNLWGFILEGTIQISLHAEIDN